MEIKRLFDKPSVRALITETEALTKDIGSGHYSRDFKVEGKGTDLGLPANEKFKLGASLSGEFEFSRVEPDNPFGTGESMPLPPSTWATAIELELAGEVNGKASTTPTAGVTLSARASAGGSLRYEMLWPQAADRSRADGIRRALRRTSLPGRVELQDLDRGEVHSLHGRFVYDLGLDLKAGFQLQEELVTDLFGGTNLLADSKLKLKGDAAVSAAMGLAGYARRSIVVGRAAPLDPTADRIRIRVHRERQRRFTFSAMLAVQLDWDLGSSIETVLDRVFDEDRLPRLSESMREVVDLAKDGDWDKLRAELSDQAKNAIGELWKKADIDDWLASNDVVQELVSAAASVVDFYENLDDEASSWWEHFLSNLGREEDREEILGVLRTVRDFDRAALEGRLDDLLTDEPDLDRVVDLVQLFSGVELEEMLIERSTTLLSALEKANSVAGKLIDAIDGVPTQLANRIRTFAEETGAANIIAQLAEHGTRIEDIDAYLRGRVQRVAEDLVGRAWSEFDAKDRKQVEQWATRVHKIISAPETLENKLKEYAKKLKGELGFSISIEIDRLERSSALLDIEIDRNEKKLLGKVEEALGRGDIADILASVQDDPDDGDGNDDAVDDWPRVVLREAVFTSTRIRTTAISTFLRFAGFGRETSKKVRRVRQRFDESIVRVEQDGGGFRRTGHYSGGFSATRSANGDETTSTVMLETRAEGRGSDISNAYRTSLEQRLRLTLSRSDQEAGEREFEWINSSLVGLGLRPRFDPDQWPAAGSSTELAVDVRFPSAAVHALVEGIVDGNSKQTNPQDSWNVSFLRAAHRYFAEPLIDDRIKPKEIAGSYLGRELYPAALRSSSFREKFPRGWFALRGEVLDLVVGSDQVRIPMTVGSGNSTVPASWAMILNPTIRRRERGLRGMRGLKEHMSAVDPGVGPSPTPDHQELSGLTQAFTRANARNTVTQSRWPSTMFQLWWVLARMASLRPELLSTASATALLRWRPHNESGPLRGPLVWATEADVGIPPLIPEVFPR